MTDAQESLSATIANAHVSPKKRGLALILCVAVGWLGGHRFYVGKVGTGLIWLLTIGCCLIGVAVDLLTILAGSFKDIDGKRLVTW